ncbi:PP2A regulatory subunit TAP46 [Hondaea fermentalgiana]|uniref:PP2A regulatory subunit TAP46 n=1 Tax=Hondaea fermentalgiana TaxID=2315210 RepID=A0A2R5G9T0_9STRA|nr:PP2A regulatory subunit TAP46 [Hondaea fermentalgiana]|eukprot:GBG24414.1 PP2A regulatory subunit TAP46 [Hondaea fermentalgiana]
MDADSRTRREAAAAAESSGADANVDEAQVAVEDEDERWLREAEEIQLKAAGRLRQPGAGAGAEDPEAAEDRQGSAPTNAKEASNSDASDFVILSEEDLRVAFREAQAAYDAIDKSDKPGGDPGLQDDISKCIKFLDMCSDAVRRMQMLSANERLADMDPSSIPFLFTNYYAGKLELKLTPQDPTGAARLRAVNAGTALLESFLEIAKTAGALDEMDKTSLAAHQHLEDLLHQDGEGNGRGGTGSALPPQMARELKMERFRRGREAKKRLEEINARLENAKGDLDAVADLGREKLEAALDCAVKDALDELDSATKEKEILQHMARMNLQFTPDSTPIPPPAPGKGITITRIDQDMINTRETIRSQVFRPSWRQPTMTIEEFAEIEMREAIEREKREKENREANPEVLNLKQVHEQGLEDDVEVYDKATEKDRNWDDWKDDNPKGRGVTKRF